MQSLFEIAPRAPPTRIQCSRMFVTSEEDTQQSPLDGEHLPPEIKEICQLRIRRMSSRPYRRIQLWRSLAEQGGVPDRGIGNNATLSRLMMQPHSNRPCQHKLINESCTQATTILFNMPYMYLIYLNLHIIHREVCSKRRLESMCILYICVLFLCAGWSPTTCIHRTDYTTHF